MMVALRGLGAARGLPVRALPVLGAAQDFPDARRSDHAPFWDLGLPAVMLTDTAELRTPHYHAASDTPDRLDYDFLARATHTTLDLVGALLTAGPSLKGSGEAPGSSP
jgi:Zn-dependent M28 family amino/carboxypeptidase